MALLDETKLKCALPRRWRQGGDTDRTPRGGFSQRFALDAPAGAAAQSP